MREYVQRLLHEQYDVTAVANGEAAIESARRQHPDLILADIMMPRLDGLDLLRAVRGDSGLRAVPVILLSARAGEEARVHGLDAGADDYLVKPFSSLELLARVRSHLAMASLRRQADDASVLLASIVESSDDAIISKTQKRSEKALRESEEKLRSLTENLETKVRDRTQELEKRSAEVFDLSMRLLRTQDDEHRHIARELHDTAGQTMTVVGMKLQRLIQKAKAGDPHLVSDVEAIRGLIERLNQDIRTTSYLLHPPLLDESGLSASLAWYIGGLSERSGITIRLDVSENLGRLPRDMELVVFRFIQECLTNIHRHADSKTATIRIARSSDVITVEVRIRAKA